MPKRRKYYRLNQYIPGPEARVVDEKGKQIGILPIREAMQRAREQGLDLVEIAPKAKPPVCKLINFKKFLFQEAKKEAEEKKKSKKVELKEIRLTPFIAENDLNTRLRRTSEFLKDNNKVKIVVRFRGPELSKKDFGYRLIEKVLEKLKDSAEVETPPKFLGRQLEISLRPVKMKNVEKNQV